MFTQNSESDKQKEVVDPTSESSEQEEVVNTASESAPTKAGAQTPPPQFTLVNVQQFYVAILFGAHHNYRGPYKMVANSYPKFLRTTLTTSDPLKTKTILHGQIQKFIEAKLFSSEHTTLVNLIAQDILDDGKILKTLFDTVEEEDHPGIQIKDFLDAIDNLHTLYLSGNVSIPIGMLQTGALDPKNDIKTVSKKLEQTLPADNQNYRYEDLTHLQYLLDSFWQSGLQFTQQKELSKAITELNKIIDLFNAIPQNLLGFLNSNLRDNALRQLAWAANEYAIDLQANPTDSNTQQMIVDNYNYAIDTIERLDTEADILNLVQYQSNLALYYIAALQNNNEALHYLQSAEANFNRLIVLTHSEKGCRQYLFLQHMLGDIYAEDKKYDDAIFHYRNAITHVESNWLNDGIELNDETFDLYRKLTMNLYRRAMLCAQTSESLRHLEFAVRDLIAALKVSQNFMHLAGEIKLCKGQMIILSYKMAILQFNYGAIDKSIDNFERLLATMDHKAFQQVNELLDRDRVTFSLSTALLRRAKLAFKQKDYFDALIDGERILSMYDLTSASRPLTLEEQRHQHEALELTQTIRQYCLTLPLVHAKHSGFFNIENQSTPSVRDKRTSLEKKGFSK